MRTIIEHRIAAVGGKGVAPFPEAFLKELLKNEQMLLSPRYVFDELNSFLAALALATGTRLWLAARQSRHVLAHRDARPLQERTRPIHA